MKRCPYCAEQIQDEAVKCKHCGSILRSSGPDTLDGQQTIQGVGPSAQYDTLDAAVTQGRGVTVLAGQYRIVRKLGEGGMGVVYLAEDMEMGNRLVAIKVLPPLLARNLRAVENLRKEAMVAINLTHPNIIRLYGFHSDGELKFLVMEYIDGQTLEEKIVRSERGRLSVEEVLPIAEQVAAALDYAHSRKPPVFHRDLKPSNVMIDKDGTVKLLDFGIAREMKDSYTRVTGQETSGTIPYMSPEQLSGDTPTAAMDIYSLAATLYESLSGHTPFHTGDIRYQIVNKTPPAIPDIPDHVNAALQSALAKSASERPTSAGDLLGRLRSPHKRGKHRAPHGRDTESSNVSHIRGKKSDDESERTYLPESRTGTRVVVGNHTGAEHASQQADSTFPTEQESSKPQHGPHSRAPGRIVSVEGRNVVAHSLAACIGLPLIMGGLYLLSQFVDALGVPPDNKIAGITLGVLFFVGLFLILPWLASLIGKRLGTSGNIFDESKLLCSACGVVIAWLRRPGRWWSPGKYTAWFDAQTNRETQLETLSRCPHCRADLWQEGNDVFAGLRRQQSRRWLAMLRAACAAMLLVLVFGLFLGVVVYIASPAHGPKTTGQLKWLALNTSSLPPGMNMKNTIGTLRMFSDGALTVPVRFQSELGKDGRTLYVRPAGIDQWETGVSRKLFLSVQATDASGKAIDSGGTIEISIESFDPAKDLKVNE